MLAIEERHLGKSHLKLAPFAHLGNERERERESNLFWSVCAGNTHPRTFAQFDYATTSSHFLAAWEEPEARRGRVYLPVIDQEEHTERRYLQ